LHLHHYPPEAAMSTTSTPAATIAKQRGSIACVGLGMTLGSHLGPLARSHIEQSDVVFAALSDGIVEMWLESMHADVRSLQPYYGEGKSRLVTYREWVEVMMVEVRAGRKVCAVFYGHPGIFAWTPHEVIKVARAEGFRAHMEPGISAEDCLYADLGIDPGRQGCQHYEASQLLFCQTPPQSRCLSGAVAGGSGRRPLVEALCHRPRIPAGAGGRA
jgi:Precorrin-6B methylase 1